jgi:hypothetical protein
MTVYLLQQGDWMRKEKMAVTMPDLPHLLCTYENLFSIPKDDYIPVGTVEYTTKYAELNDIKLPENITYPSTLDYYLKRLIYQDTFKNVQSNFASRYINISVSRHAKSASSIRSNHS